MKAKRFLALFSACSLCLMSFPVSAEVLQTAGKSAEETPTTADFLGYDENGYEIMDGSDIIISASQIYAQPGETVAVSLSIQNNPGYVNLTTNIQYDERLTPEVKSEYVPVYSIGPAASGLSLLMGINQDGHRVGPSTQGTRNCNTDGEMWTVYFTVPVDALPGDVYSLQTGVYGGLIHYASSGSSSTSHYDYQGMQLVDGWIRVPEATYPPETDPVETTAQSSEPEYPEYDENGYEILDGSSIVVSASQVYAQPGETVPVSLYLQNNPGYVGLAAYLDYDERLIPEVQSEYIPVYDIGPAISDLTLSMGIHQDANYVEASTSGTENCIEEGELWTVYFTVPDDAQPGDVYPLDVSVEDGLIYAEGFGDSYTYYDFQGLQIEDGWIQVVEGEETYPPETTTITTTTTETTTSSSEPEYDENGYEIRDGSDIIISASQVYARPGERVAVSISIRNNPGYETLTSRFIYDGRLIPDVEGTYEPVYDIGPAVTNLAVAIGINQDENLVGASTYGADNCYEDGVMWTVYFTVPEDAQPGDVYSLQTDVVGPLKKYEDSDYYAYYGMQLEDGWIEVIGEEETDPFDTTFTTTTTETTTTTPIPFSPLYDEYGNQLVDENGYEVWDGSSIVVSASKVYAQPGERVAVSLSIRNNPGYVNLTSNIQYDERLIPDVEDTYKPVYDIGPAAFGLSLSMGINEDSHRVGPASIGMRNCTEDGVMWTVYFTVPEDAQPGDVFSLQTNVMDNHLTYMLKEEDSTTTYYTFSGIQTEDGWIQVAGETTCPPETTTYYETTTETTTVTTEMTASSTETWYASEGDFLGWAIKDYAAKTGVTPVGTYITKNPDSTLSIFLKDEDGNVLDVYTINPITGRGYDAVGEIVNLPQTGLISYKTAGTVAGAAFLILMGSIFLCISRKRRKEETEA